MPIIAILTFFLLFKTEFVIFFQGVKLTFFLDLILKNFTDYNQNNSLDWMIVCDQPLYQGGTIRFYPEIQTEKENPVTYSGGGGNLDTMNKIGINTTEPSGFQCAEAIIFNRIFHIHINIKKS